MADPGRKCAACSRGVTHGRIARDGAVLVVTLEGSRLYCGLCVFHDRLRVGEGDHLTLLLCPNPDAPRGERRVVRRRLEWGLDESVDPPAAELRHRLGV